MKAQDPSKADLKRSATGTAPAAGIPGAVFCMGLKPAAEAVKMIHPPPALTISGMANLAPKNPALS